MAMTDAQRRAESKYRADSIRLYNLKINRNTNAEELAHFEEQPNKSAYLMGLIRDDMKGRTMKTVSEILANWETERHNEWYAIDEIATDGRTLRLFVGDAATAKRKAADYVTGANLVDFEGNPCEPGEFGDEPFFRCQLISSEEAKAYFESCMA